MSITDYDGLYGGGDIVLERRHDGMACANVPHAIIQHSPTGYEWGYGGSGPADLALNILLAVTGDRAVAERHHQQFKADFLVGIPTEGGRIAREQVLDFVHRQEGAAA